MFHPASQQNIQRQDDADKSRSDKLLRCSSPQAYKFCRGCLFSWIYFFLETTQHLYTPHIFIYSIDSAGACGIDLFFIAYRSPFSTAIQYLISKMPFCDKSFQGGEFKQFFQKTSRKIFMQVQKGVSYRTIGVQGN